jgi:hypothetical protein
MDTGVPDFASAFPREFLGKVCSAGDGELAVEQAGEWAGEPYRVIDGGQLVSGEGWDCG